MGGCPRVCVVLGGCVIGETVLVAGGYCVGMLIGVLLTCFSTENVCAVRVCCSFQDTFKVVFAPFEPTTNS